MTEALTAERILEAAEDTLRRFGPGKTTVVDVARALGVSHGSVYRHFPNKAALRDAVAARWLDRINEPLRPLTTEDAPATERLRNWLELLSTTKRRMAREDPELFATYHALATESREVVGAHLETLAGMIARIVSDGVARGEFEVDDPHRAAKAVLSATARFHNPAHASEWDDPELDADFEEVWALLLRGLASGRR
ncbi:TetR/AcrR family transcriptional regulator [Actinopolyspora erythraea]|uniref:TetR family transcriptional regulator n=2 Tax=Actinopolyspora TaxID=1849 RepID=A0A099D2L2_9ACTN|nr:MULTISPECIES: TetR family transcriptional regulator [Actinopolyspora]ASU77471.1 TetR/AcrR family transcriptional regulator [Actinopolyspora erythraea]KGI80314.1 TetR family transcriptional regulator [Actinopolyspora erythraea]SDO95946.1 transcriptional regulator, TetR family [Actinopolyspora xinjiangensis]